MVLLLLIVDVFIFWLYADSVAALSASMIARIGGSFRIRCDAGVRIRIAGE